MLSTVISSTRRRQDGPGHDGLTIRTREVSRVVKVSDSIGFKKAENGEFYPFEYDDRDKLLLSKQVGVWDFRPENAGWSGLPDNDDGRAMELAVEANIASIDVSKTLKYNNIIRYKSQLARIHRQGRRQHPIKMGIPPGSFSPNLSVNDNMTKYARDVELGMYDAAKEEAARVFDVDYDLFWDDIRTRLEEATFEHLKDVQRILEEEETRLTTLLDDAFVIELRGQLDIILNKLGRNRRKMMEISSMNRNDHGV